MSSPSHVVSPLETSGRAGTAVPPMKGGGEMGRRVRDTDWSATPLGAYATWPQSLRSSLSLVLNAKGIAALYWGPDQWLLYNDAYGVALGDRHPDAFGHPMPDVLTDIAPVLGPQVAAVLRTGEGFAIENLPMTMRRHGRDEETVWTYSFSPVQGETGDFAGVLLLATEMTEQKAAERRLRDSQDRLTALAEASSEAFYSMSPDWGEMRQLTGRGFLADTASANRDWMTDYILPDDRPTVGAAIAEAIRTRSAFHFEHRVRRVDGSVGWTASRAVPLLDAAGAVAEWFGAASDITKRIHAERSAERVRRRLEAALRVAKLGTYDWHTSTGVVELDARARDIFGLPASGVIRDDDVFGRMAPEDLDRARTEAMEVFGQRDRPETGTFAPSVDVDYDILLPDGSRRSVASSGTLMLDDDGERRVVGSFDDVTDLKRAEARLRGQNTALERQVAERTSELRLYRDIVQSDPSPILAFDNDHRLIGFNRAHAEQFLRVMGRVQQVGDVLPDLFPPDQAQLLRSLMDRALAGEAFSVVESFGDPEREEPTWDVAYTPLRDEGGRIVGAFHHARDIGARLAAEAELATAQEALRQSQKMEAVGQLTGGLAHDFNNLLTGISGSLDLLQRRVAQGRINDLDRYLTAAQGASKRAAALTHRLLAFSRRQTLDPRPTDVRKLILGMVDLIRRTVGPEIVVETVDMVGLWTALVDPSQLENALLNLCINARDAMPDGGRITVETGNTWMDDRAAKERDLPPGQYLSVCVSDSGTGMPPDVIAHAFEPFFTTKPLGQGTGLGLSMIYGFARQSGGQVRIYSEVGQGTTICIYLPRHYGAEDAQGAQTERRDVARAEVGETVLVVDDEPTVRMLVADVLSDLGYSAIEAEDGPSGLRSLQGAGRVDLLITDVGLPGGMNGRQVADAARALRPGLKVLFITGYAENAAVGNGHLEPGMAVLTKPFAMDELGAKIRTLIEG